MPHPNGHSRRSFLGSALAAGAGAVLLGDSAFATRLSWCRGRVHPFAEKRLTVHAGSLPAGTPAALRLLVAGPGWAEPLVLAESALTLDSAESFWDLALDYDHPDLVPGRWEFYVEAEVDGRILVSPPIGYTLRPFVFGV